MEFHENNKTFKKDSLDHFDKDVIKNVIYGYFSKNKCVTLRKLKVELDENHGIKLTKYKLWKTLHELGFRYTKLSGKRKALVERVDIVNQRINYLRTIKKKGKRDSSLSSWMRLGVTPTTPLLINGLLKMTQKTENYH